MGGTYLLDAHVHQRLLMHTLMLHSKANQAHADAGRSCLLSTPYTGCDSGAEKCPHSRHVHQQLSLAGPLGRHLRVCMAYGRVYQIRVNTPRQKLVKGLLQIDNTPVEGTLSLAGLYSTPRTMIDSTHYY